MNFSRKLNPNSQAYPGNIFATWIRRFKMKYANWESITENQVNRFGLLMDFFMYKLGNINGTFFRR